MNYEIICNQVLELTKEVGLYIKSERKKFRENEIETKSRNNFVTYLDKKSEELIINGLKKILPEAGYIAEENTETSRGELYNWIIDPIDGTTNFIHGLPPYAISIGLAKNDEIVIGVIFEIVLEEMFYAWKESPAFLNGHIIKVSNVNQVSASLIATGFPYTESNMMDRFFDSLKHVYRNTHGFRRLGSAATDLAYVACGRFDAFFEFNLNPWDVAAGSLIVKQAGGMVTDFNKGSNFIFGKEIVATNGLIHTDFSEIIQKYLKN